MASQSIHGPTYRVRAEARVNAGEKFTPGTTHARRSARRQTLRDTVAITQNKGGKR